MKEPNRPLELLVLEPEKNRLILCSLESEFQSELKRGLVFCSTQIREARFYYRVCHKNKTKKRFFIERVHFF